MKLPTREDISLLFKRIWEQTHPATRHEFAPYEAPDHLLANGVGPYISELQAIERQLRLGQPLPSQRDLLWYRRKNLLTLMHSFEAGFEAEKPPEEWFGGGVDDKWDAEQWPGRIGYYQFGGVLPVFVQEAYLKAVQIFGRPNIRLYAERRENFGTQLPIAQGVGMMAIYSRANFGTISKVYFRIVRWRNEDIEGVRALLEDGKGKPAEDPRS